MLASAFVLQQLLGCGGQGQAVGVSRYDVVYLVEDEVGISLGTLNREGGNLGKGFAFFGLLEIGHHGYGSLTAIVHLVKVDQQMGVARAKVDALWEEHWRVAMRVEHDVCIMKRLGLGIQLGFVYQPSEQRLAIGLQPFGMPLHAQQRLVLVALYGLDNAIGSQRAHLQFRPWCAHGLVVEGVDVDVLVVVEERAQQGVGQQRYAVGGLAFVSILAVLQSAFLRPHVLLHGATQGCGEHLQASAYAHDGHATVVGQAGDEQLGQVACGVDVAQCGYGFFVGPQGVEVGTACEQQGVDAVEC